MITQLKIFKAPCTDEGFQDLERRINRFLARLQGDYGGYTYTTSNDMGDEGSSILMVIHYTVHDPTGREPSEEQAKDIYGQLAETLAEKGS